MYVYGSNHWDFVLCTRTAMHIERIEWEESFIRDTVSKLEAFYDNVYLLEVVYPRVKQGLSQIDLWKLQ